jgi:radical SAM superfamily enzyme YgiQ (UPF0313 family)
LEGRGYQARVSDHSIGLFERIFCKTGLERIFADARRVYENRGLPPAAGAVEAAEPGLDFNNPYLLFQTERFLSEEGRWLSCINRLVSFLRGRDREWGHLLSLANGVLPGGPRFDACLDSLGGNPPPDAAPLLASKLLADLADFISSVLDPSFGLVRYAGTMASASRDFARVKGRADRYIMTEFYQPFLDEWQDREGLAGAMVLALTIPFAGCLAGALACAAWARERLGEACVVIAGGGYVNTELRFLEDETVFDYFDYLSFDRGYASLAAILERLGTKGVPSAPNVPGTPEEPALYKTLYRSRRDRRIIGSPDSAGPEDRGCPEDWAAVRTVFPDYGEVDFSRYLYPVDEANPMHRLWSDGHWLKAYLAHGCYWHACAFCDTALDYIRGFEPVDTDALFRHLLDQAEKTQVRAVHLVDEAVPPASLVKLAELNMRAGLPLVFWGNIRFEKAFTPDTAAFLAAGGLLGVSGGLEVASEGGFRRVRKGLSLGEAVRAAAAFKEAGILTHAYLIYGYWDETPAEIINSAEILRQLFAEGLLDSAFWHQFILTRHSPLYAEWQAGGHPGLRVSAGDEKAGGPGKLFALNDLSFAGERQFEKYGEPLDRLLAAWMAGDTAGPVDRAFPFPVPAPGIPGGFAAGLLDAYARERDRARGAPPRGGRACFLGSRPLVTAAPQGAVPRGAARATLFWRWRLEDQRLRLPEAVAEKAGALLAEAARPGGMEAVFLYKELEDLPGVGLGVWKKLRNRGLVVIP